MFLPPDDAQLGSMARPIICVILDQALRPYDVSNGDMQILSLHLTPKEREVFQN
jgi:hypothetical protein